MSDAALREGWGVVERDNLAKCILAFFAVMESLFGSWRRSGGFGAAYKFDSVVSCVLFVMSALWRESRRFAEAGVKSRVFQDEILNI